MNIIPLPRSPFNYDKNQKDFKMVYTYGLRVLARMRGTLRRLCGCGLRRVPSSDSSLLSNLLQTSSLIPAKPNLCKVGLRS